MAASKSEREKKSKALAVEGKRDFSIVLDRMLAPAALAAVGKAKDHNLEDHRVCCELLGPIGAATEAFAPSA